MKFKFISIFLSILALNTLCAIQDCTVKTYCPSENDLTVGYGNPKIYDQGWSVKGSGSVATKASYNLLEVLNTISTLVVPTLE